MTFVAPSRRGSIVAEAFRLHALAGKAETKQAKRETKPALRGTLPKEDAVRSEPYRRLVAALPCINCGKQGRSQAAHPPPTGKGIKEDDRECFPLCCDGPRYRGCHPKFDASELVPRAQMRQQAQEWGIQTRAQITAMGDWPKKLPPFQQKKTAIKRGAKHA